MKLVMTCALVLLVAAVVLGNPEAKTRAKTEAKTRAKSAAKSRARRNDVAEGSYISESGGALEDAYGYTNEDDLTEQEFVRAAGWLHSVGNAFKSAAKWTKKAAQDAGHWTANAAKDALKYTKKGCGVVNQLPVSEMVYHHELTEEQVKAGVNEEQLAAGYSALKAGCKLLG